MASAEKKELSELLEDIKKNPNSKKTYEALNAALKREHNSLVNNIENKKQIANTLNELTTKITRQLDVQLKAKPQSVLFTPNAALTYNLNQLQKQLTPILRLEPQMQQLRLEQRSPQKKLTPFSTKTPRPLNPNDPNYRG